MEFLSHTHIILHFTIQSKDTPQKEFTFPLPVYNKVPPLRNYILRSGCDSLLFSSYCSIVSIIVQQLLFYCFHYCSPWKRWNFTVLVKLQTLSEASDKNIIAIVEGLEINNVVI